MPPDYILAVTQTQAWLKEAIKNCDGSHMDSLCSQEWNNANYWAGKKKAFKEALDRLNAAVGD